VDVVRLVFRGSWRSESACGSPSACRAFQKLAPLLFALALGCGDDTEPAGDAGPRPDAGHLDAGADPEDAGPPPDGGRPDAGPPVFEEVDGTVAFEAEHYTRVELDDQRSWELTTATRWPELTPDPDPPHVEGASGGAYLEALPDDRAFAGDPGMDGVSFHRDGDTGPRLTYRVSFRQAGTYVVWVRGHSTGTEDNGIHSGIDGEFPEPGLRIQFCAGKNAWTWSSAQRRADDTCGTPRTVTLTVDEPGLHEIHLAMREDGFELDKIVLTMDPDLTPEGTGPEPRILE